MGTRTPARRARRRRSPAGGRMRRRPRSAPSRRRRSGWCSRWPPRGDGVYAVEATSPPRLLHPRAPAVPVSGIPQPRRRLARMAGRPCGRSVGRTSADRAEEPPMSSTPSPARRSDRAPTFSHAVVQDVMRPGIVTCPPDEERVAVARRMAVNHIHAVVVSGIETVPGGERLTWGLITALDLVGSTQAGYEGAEAADLASSEIVTVELDEPLGRAAQLMVEHQLTHLIVVTGGEPVGIVSTLDVAGCLAWGEA